MEGMEETKRLLQLEFDVQHINVLSRTNRKEHAVVRLIISSLATSEEIQSLKKDSIGAKSENPTVSLTTPGKGRTIPIDEKTYTLLKDLTQKMSRKERIFSYTDEDLDEIVNKYSPRRTKYNVKKVREAVMEILNDCMLLGDKDYVDELIKGKNSSGLKDFLYDFHPLYTGTWDIEDDEDVAREFILSYSSYNGIYEPEKIAEETGESEERVSKLLE
ncbi:MAG: hypothetical protein ACLFVX_09055 [Archaeoglobaceae archaeon]